MGLLRKSAQRKIANHKKTSHGNISKRSSVFFSKEKNCMQRRDILGSEKGFQLIKESTAPVTIILSWFGTVCSRPVFCERIGV